MPNDPFAAEVLAPLEIQLAVPCPPDRAFLYFTRDIGQWWPLASHSVCQSEAASVAFEPQVGGRIVETSRSGAQHVWGTIAVWVPGERMRFSWHPGGTAEQSLWVEVTFVANPKGTLVTLTQGGWEVLGAAAGPTRDGYANGWVSVFQQCYANYCSTSGGQS